MLRFEDRFTRLFPADADTGRQPRADRLPARPHRAAGGVPLVAGEPAADLAGGHTRAGRPARQAGRWPVCAHVAAPGHRTGVAGLHPEPGVPGGTPDCQAAGAPGQRGRRCAPQRRPQPACRMEQPRRDRPPGDGLQRHAGPARPRAAAAAGAGGQCTRRRGPA